MFLQRSPSRLHMTSRSARDFFRPNLASTVLFLSFCASSLCLGLRECIILLPKKYCSASWLVARQASLSWLKFIRISSMVFRRTNGEDCWGGFWRGRGGIHGGGIRESCGWFDWCVEDVWTLWSGLIREDCWAGNCVQLIGGLYCRALDDDWIDRDEERGCWWSHNWRWWVDEKVGVTGDGEQEMSSMKEWWESLNESNNSCVSRSSNESSKSWLSRLLPLVGVDDMVGLVE